VRVVKLIARAIPILFVSLLALAPSPGFTQDEQQTAPVVTEPAPASNTVSPDAKVKSPVAGAEATQQTAVPAVSVALEKLDAADKALTEFAKVIEEDADNDSKLVEVNVKLEELSRALIEVGVSLRPRLTEIKSQIETLGEAPKEGEPAEPEDLAAERQRLVQERANINSLTGRAEAASIQAGRLIKSITETRRALFTDTLLNSTSINPGFFSEAGVAFLDELGDFERIITGWLRFSLSFKFQALMAACFLSSVVALGILLISMRFFGRALNRDSKIEDPSYLSRLTAAFWSAVIPTVAVAIIFAATFAIFDGLSVLRPDISRIIGGLFAALIVLTFVTRVAKAVLAPFNPRWRLINFSNRGARNVYFNIVAMVMVNALDFFLGSVSETLGSPLVLTVAKSFFATLIVGLILISTSRVSPMLAESGDKNDEGRRWPKLIKYALIFFGVLMIVLSLIGYVGLSRFVSQQILITGSILAILYIGFLSGHEVMEPGKFSVTWIGRYIEDHFEPKPGRLDRMGIVAGLLINFLALVIGIPLILLQWGFKVQDIQLLAYRAFTDIQIGGISISLSGILVGILLFLLGLYGTRFFQRWLDGRVMSRSRMDPGLRNSIRTGIGYLGVAVAGVIGVVAAGIDLSSLAIVAGALSLGIGFGLQNIVSNFVSGLILLAERPFKVGDWVESGTTQGFVKRISVRATEIETFQMQTIIVPNSELINGTVGNWNHRNSAARADIEVGVGYNSDPEKVIEILQEIALAHDHVMRNPPPVVHFLNFGASSLDFVLKVYLADVLTGMSVKNDLRVAIFKRFAAEGIEIPFPQTDVNFSMKDVPDGLADKIGAEKAGKVRASQAKKTGRAAKAEPRKRQGIRLDEPDGDPSEQ